MEEDGWGMLRSEGDKEVEEEPESQDLPAMESSFV